MKGSTHLALGTTTGILAGVQVYNTIGGTPGVTTAILTTATCMAGSLFPDIDVETSKISHIFKPISKVINKHCGHRGMNSYGQYVGGIFQGLFHSPFLYILIGILLFALSASLPYPQMYGIVIGFTLGTMLHLLQDLCTKGGIPLLYPVYRKNIHILPFKTGNIIELFISAIIFMVIVFVLKLLN